MRDLSSCFAAVVPSVSMPQRPTIASVQGLTLRLSRRTVLYDIHLEFPRRSFTAIMGPGGSGKSTLARLLAGQLPVCSDIDFFGRILRPEAGQLGFVTQRPRQSALSVRTMLMDVDASSMAAVGDEDWSAYLRREGFEHLALPLDDSADLLSRDEQQILRIAAARWRGPEMLVLDEPFAGLFGGQEDDLIAYVERIKAFHTIVLIEHHQARARQLSDRVALLAAGQLIEVNATHSFFENPQSMHSEQFIRSGGCSVTSVDAELALLTSDTDNLTLRRLTELSRSHALSDDEDENRTPSVRPVTQPQPTLIATSGADNAIPNTGEFPVLSPSVWMEEHTHDLPIEHTAPRNVTASQSDGPSADDALYTATEPESSTRHALTPTEASSTDETHSAHASSPPLPSETTNAPSASPELERSERVSGQARILAPWAHSTPPTSDATTAPIVRYFQPNGVPLQQSDTRGRGPQGFCWMIPGELAGCPRPGIVEPISRDLDRIARTGTQVIVTLTQSELVASPEDLQLFHEICYFPVVDMEAPHRETAIEVCRRMEQHVRAGKAVVYHCRAGLGRTGTMLVMHLIGRGMPPDEALAWARTMNAYWVQSHSQEAFLHTLPVGFLRDET